MLVGAALLSYDLLQETRTQPPGPLQNTAALLHDNCLLVR